MKERYGTDSMPETGENVAQDFQVSRADQDAFALRSQQRAAKAQAAGSSPGRSCRSMPPAGAAGPIVVDTDEHPRADTTAETLAKLKPIVRADGTVTAGNASGVNDGAGALILASTDAVAQHGLHAARARAGHGRPRASRRASWGSARCRRVQKLLRPAGVRVVGFRRHRAQRGVRQPRRSPCCAGWACRTTRST